MEGSSGPTNSIGGGNVATYDPPLINKENKKKPLRQIIKRKDPVEGK
jgi:hypothetical protein